MVSWEDTAADTEGDLRSSSEVGWGWPVRGEARLRSEGWRAAPPPPPPPPLPGGLWLDSGILMHAPALLSGSTLQKLTPTTWKY